MIEGAETEAVATEETPQETGATYLGRGAAMPTETANNPTGDTEITPLGLGENKEKEEPKAEILGEDGKPVEKVEEKTEEAAPEAGDKKEKDSATTYGLDGEKVETESSLDTDKQQEFNPETFIHDQTNGEYGSVEEMYEEMEDMRRANEFNASVPQTLEEIEGLIEEHMGMSLMDYKQLKSMKLDDMSSADLIAEGLRLKDQGITNDEIDLELSEFDLLSYPDDEIKQMISDEKITEREYNNLEAKFNRTARQYKIELKKRQSETTLEALEGKSVTTQREQAPQYTPEELSTSYDEALSKYDNEAFSVMDGDKSLLNFSFRITEKDRESAVENLVNWNKWQQDNLFKEGAPDAREYTNLMFLKDNLNTILKTTYKEAFSKGQKALVENEDNITLGQRKSIVPSNKKEGDTTITEAVRGMLNDRIKR